MRAYPTPEEHAASPRRRLEVRRGDEWVVMDMADLVVGDRFRMFEEDGSAFEGGWIATVAELPTPNPLDGTRWRVMCLGDCPVP